MIVYIVIAVFVSCALAVMIAGTYGRVSHAVSILLAFGLLASALGLAFVKKLVVMGML